MCILVSESIHKQTKIQNEGPIETQWLKLNVGKKPIFLGNVYGLQEKECKGDREDFFAALTEEILHYKSRGGHLTHG